MTGSSTYRAEIRRIKRGIAISWVVNILVMSATIEAILIFGFLGIREDNAEIASFLVRTIPVSVIVGVIATAIAAMSSTKRMMGATSGDLVPVEDGVLYDVVEEMSLASGVDMPEVYLSVGSGVANAYAVSDSNGSRLVVTDMLLKMMNRSELQGVVGHEIGHIASGDSQAMTTLVAMTAFTGMIAGSAWRFGGGDRDGDRNGSANPLAIVLIVLSFVFILMAPVLASLSEACMSRQRESDADMLSVKFTGNPDALCNALMKLDASDGAIDPAAAKKFNSKAGYLAFHVPSIRGIGLGTHPPIKERVARLMSVGAIGSGRPDDATRTESGD